MLDAVYLGASSFVIYGAYSSRAVCPKRANLSAILPYALCWFHWIQCLIPSASRLTIVSVGYDRTSCPIGRMTIKTLSVKVPSRVDAALKRLAAERHQTKSSLAREAIEAVIDTKAKAGSRSCAALSADLAGCFEGPRDLSAHKRHMEGYGQ